MNKEVVSKSHCKVTIKDRHINYGWRVAWAERMVPGGKYINMLREIEVTTSDDPNAISEEIFRLNNVAIRKYQATKQSEASSKAKLQRRISRRDDKIAELYEFVDKRFEYLFDVYQDLRPKDHHVTKRGREFSFRSKPKSYVSFVVEHLRKKGHDDELDLIIQKCDDLGLSTGLLAAI